MNDMSQFVRFCQKERVYTRAIGTCSKSENANDKIVVASVSTTNIGATSDSYTSYQPLQRQSNQIYKPIRAQKYSFQSIINSSVGGTTDETYKRKYDLWLDWVDQYRADGHRVPTMQQVARGDRLME